jgi:O-antigen/teichoic acid export membrane protein
MFGLLPFIKNLDKDICMNSTSFINNTLLLVAGTLIAQLVSISAYPMLAHLYGPTAFGLMALFISITNVTSIISCMRYESSIILPELDEDAVNLLAGCISIAIINTVIMVILVFFCQHLFSLWLHLSSIEWSLWLVPFIALVDGIFNSLNYWNTRKKSFLRLSIARISNSLFTISSQLYTGFSGNPVADGLIGGIAFGKSISTGILGWQIWHGDKSLLSYSISRKHMIKVLKRYIKFPLYDFCAELLNTISWQLPVFLLSAFFSPAIVGFYSFGLSLLQLPMRFIGGSITQVFFQHAAEAKINDSLSALVEHVFRVLLLIGMFPILTLSFIGEDFFSLVFGETWSEAGIYSQMLGIWVLLWFISSPLSTLYYLYEKQQMYLKFTILNFAIRVITLCIGGYMGNARLSICLFSLAGICSYGYLCLDIMNVAGIEWRKTMHIILSRLTSFIPAGIVLLIVKILADNQFIITAISVLLCIIYYIYIFSMEPDARHMLKCLLNKKSS